MSTALLATSLSALLRFFAITAACTGPAWPGSLLALFGALSMVMAMPVPAGAGRVQAAARLLEHRARRACHARDRLRHAARGLRQDCSTCWCNRSPRRSRSCSPARSAAARTRGAWTTVAGVLEASPALGAAPDDRRHRPGRPAARGHVRLGVARARGRVREQPRRRRARRARRVRRRVPRASRSTGRAWCSAARASGFADPLPGGLARADVARCWGAGRCSASSCPRPVRALIEQAALVVRP